MEIQEFIDKWQKISNKIWNEGKYKKLCHIDPQPWFSESKTIDTILDELRALDKTSGENAALPIFGVSNSLPTPENIKRWHALLVGKGEQAMYDDMRQ